MLAKSGPNPGKAALGSTTSGQRSPSLVGGGDGVEWGGGGGLTNEPDKTLHGDLGLLHKMYPSGREGRRPNFSGCLLTGVTRKRTERNNPILRRSTEDWHVDIFPLCWPPRPLRRSRMQPGTRNRLFNLPPYLPLSDVQLGSHGKLMVHTKKKGKVKCCSPSTGNSQTTTGTRRHAIIPK